MANTNDYEKPSKTRQWQERSDRPVATRPMTAREIVEYGRILADSYKCDASEITFEFEKIQDENDTDRDDCLWLKYKMKCVGLDGKSGVRDVFKIKLPIPEEVRRAGEDVLRRQAQQRTRNRTNLLPAPTVPAQPTVAPPTVTAPTPSTTQSPTAPTEPTIAHTTPSTTQPTATTQPTTAPAAPRVRRPATKRK